MLHFNSSLNRVRLIVYPMKGSSHGDIVPATYFFCSGIADDKLRVSAENDLKKGSWNYVANCSGGLEQTTRNTLIHDFLSGFGG